MIRRPIDNGLDLHTPSGKFTLSFGVPVEPKSLDLSIARPSRALPLSTNQASVLLDPYIATELGGASRPSRISWHQTDDGYVVDYGFTLMPLSISYRISSDTETIRHPRADGFTCGDITRIQVVIALTLTYPVVTIAPMTSDSGLAKANALMATARRMLANLETSYTGAAGLSEAPRVSWRHDTQAWLPSSSIQTD